MRYKIQELDAAFETSDVEFPPSKSFFLSRANIQDSEVFKFIRQMPKGAALHTHHISLGPIQWVIKNLTYRDKLYMRLDEESVSGPETCGHSYKHFKSVNYDPRVVIWVIF